MGRTDTGWERAGGGSETLALYKAMCSLIIQLYSGPDTKYSRGVARIFQRKGEGGHTVSNRGFSPDLSYRLPRCVLL